MFNYTKNKVETVVVGPNNNIKKIFALFYNFSVYGFEYNGTELILSASFVCVFA